MEYRTTDIRTGLFIAFSISAGTILIFFMGGVRGAFRDARVIRAHFDDVRLLEVQAPVTLRGYRVGEVAQISRHDNPGTDGEKRYEVAVLMAVDRDLDLRADASAVVKTDGIIGPKFVALFPGVSDRPLAPNAAIPGRAETDMAGIIARLEGPVARLDAILGQVESFAGSQA